MQRIRARLDRHVDGAAGNAAELGRIDALDQRELFHGVHARLEPRAVTGQLGHLNTVQPKRVVRVSLAVDAAGGLILDDRSHRAGRDVVAIAGVHAGREPGQLHEVPPIQREIDDSSLGDHLRRGRVVCLQDGSFPGDGDCLPCLADDQLKVHARARWSIVTGTSFTSLDRKPGACARRS